MSRDTVINKIMKLLALSKSSNEHEAANAAAQAAKLMRDHEIEEAHLRVADKTKKAEPIVFETIERSNRRQLWRGTVATSLAQSLGCHMWWEGPNVRVMGRTSATRTMTYTYQFLCNEIDRLSHEIYGGQNLRLAPAAAVAWKNGFRHGAAATIAQRLAQEQRKHVAASVAQIASAPESPTSNALVLVRADQAELDQLFEKKGKDEKWKPIRASSYGTAHGFHAGRKAGADISLGGAAGAIGATPGKLKS